ncbi:hypothetical protein ACF3M1_01615 [Luteimonas sp. WGS1318]|uniref:hypothetical protein n=1 Tax=Luteimonas sp. WGS1318 TaxID=3366815 RepID=UPI00372D0756
MDSGAARAARLRQGRQTRFEISRDVRQRHVDAAGDAVSPMHSVTLAIAAGVIAGVGAHQSLVAEAAAGGGSGA